jgi:hypothetical protein
VSTPTLRRNHSHKLGLPGLAGGAGEVKVVIN